MKVTDMPTRIDFGEGRYLEFTHNHDGDIVGAIECHPAARDYDIPRTSGLEPFHVKAGSPCEGAMRFDVPEALAYNDGPNVPKWRVESWDPLTLSPSVLCGVCGNHGFVRNGKWVPA